MLAMETTESADFAQYDYKINTTMSIEIDGIQSLLDENMGTIYRTFSQIVGQLQLYYETNSFEVNEDELTMCTSTLEAGLIASEINIFDVNSSITDGNIVISCKNKDLDPDQFFAVNVYVS